VSIVIATSSLQIGELLPASPNAFNSGLPKFQPAPIPDSRKVALHRPVAAQTPLLINATGDDIIN
jgi:hypothetical protein